MGIFKQFGDMKKMVQAAPGLIEQAQGLQGQAAQHQQSMDAMAIHLLTAEPQPGNLDPIAGVDLERYARIVKGIAPYGYDDSKLVEVASGLGVDAASWAEAQSVWAARIQADRGVGRRFDEICTAV